MRRSPCLDCDRIGESKTKCSKKCEKLKNFQEALIKPSGIYQGCEGIDLNSIGINLGFKCTSYKGYLVVSR